MALSSGLLTAVELGVGFVDVSDPYIYIYLQQSIYSSTRISYI